MNSTHFSGVYTALVTPMLDGKVCLDDFQGLIERQISEGIDGLVPIGTTGESPTLSRGEEKELIACAVETAKGRVPVIAGAGSNSTEEAVSYTRQAHEAGVDGLLHVAPYYNKPSQEGLFRHFSAVAETTDKPIFLYSIPGRCVIDIAVDTVVRLRSRYPHVCVIKESGGDCDRVAELRNALGDDITIFSGDDSLTLPFISAGAGGVISVASNLVVKDLVKMVHCALDNDFATASGLHLKYYPLFKALFAEPSPAPIKEALKRAGIIQSAEVRLPLCEVTGGGRQGMFSVLESLGY